MKRNSLARIWLTSLTTSVAIVALACDDTGLFPPGFPNSVDTVTLYALRGTPITAPSAYDIASGTVARTDRGDALDFAFDIDTAGSAVLLPAGRLGLTAQAGLQLSAKTFDELDRAPYDDYVVDSVLTVSVGDVLVGRSRNASGNCYYYGALPRYGKFRVMELDLDNRTITLEALVNVNCGYRGLEPGYPTS